MSNNLGGLEAIDLNKPKIKKWVAFGGHNRKRSSRIYSPLEKTALQCFNGHIERHNLKHEVKLMGHDHKITKDKKRFTYHIDFYSPMKKIAIEIDPNFHKSYLPVVIGDIIRDLRLESILGITTIRITDKDLKNGGYSEKLKILDSMPDSPNCLDYWLKNEKEVI